VAVEDDAIRAAASARDQTGDQTQVTTGEIGAWEHHDNNDVTGAVKRQYCGTDEQIVSTIRVAMVWHVHTQAVYAVRQSPCMVECTWQSWQQGIKGDVLRVAR
jgi:hypothetical protein